MKSFSKISLLKYNSDLRYEDQMVGINIEFSEEVQNQDGGFEFAKESKTSLKNFFCHNDLVQKFNRLRSHLAMVCEMQNPEIRSINIETDDPDFLAPKIYATGVVMTGGGSDEGLIIVGFKVLSNGAKLNLVTPNINYEEYQFGSDLIDLQAEIERETAKALDGKRKIVQGDLFDDGQGSSEADGGTDDEMFEPQDNKIHLLTHKGKKSTVTITTGSRKVEM